MKDDGSTQRHREGENDGIANGNVNKGVKVWPQYDDCKDSKRPSSATALRKILPADKPAPTSPPAPPRPPNPTPWRNHTASLSVSRLVPALNYVPPPSNYQRAFTFATQMYGNCGLDWSTFVVDGEVRSCWRVERELWMGKSFFEACGVRVVGETCSAEGGFLGPTMGACEAAVAEGEGEVRFEDWIEERFL